MNLSFDPIHKIWTGADNPHFYNPEANCGAIIFGALKRNPTKVVQIDAETGNSMTAAELQVLTIRAAQNFTAKGFIKGDVVAIVCANNEHLAPIVGALLTLGVTIAPIAPIRKVEEMAHMMKGSQPKAILCDANLYKTVIEADKIANHRRAVIYVFQSDDVIDNKAESFLERTGKEHTFVVQHLGNSYLLPAFILGSSGTTDKPKAVCLSHAYMISIFMSYFSVGDRAVTFSNISWASGLWVLLMSLVATKTNIITRKPFSVDNFYHLMETWKFNYFHSVPPFAKLILQDDRAKVADWSHLKIWVLVGSFAPDDIRREIDSLLPDGRTVYIMGTTEVGLIASDLLNRKPTAIGQLSPNVQAKIVNKNGEALENGNRGELLVKTPVQFLGYCNSQDVKTAKLDKDGFFRTGDIAYFDDEGYLYYVGRENDRIIYKTYDIEPTDIETIIARIEGVQQVCVVGVQMRIGDEDMATAAIVKNANSSLTEDAIVNIVNSQVADFQFLRGGVFFLSEMPLTASGKILRRKVKEIVQEMVEFRKENYTADKLFKKCTDIC